MWAGCRPFLSLIRGAWPARPALSPTNKIFSITYDFHLRAGNNGYVDSGIVLGHEMGHVASRMGLFLQPAEPYYADQDVNARNGSKMALRFENRVRKNKDPKGPTRTKEK